MNVTTRRQKIEAMLADDPADTFLRYSLGLELEKEGDHDRSLELLAALTKDQTPYVPAFFMAGAAAGEAQPRRRCANDATRWHRRSSATAESSCRR